MARTSATRNKQRAAPGSAWPFVFAVFVASRLLFFGVGALARVFLPEAEPAGSPLEPAGFLNYWAHWDGAWYAQIATEGYGAGAPASTAFFPLYPMLVRLGTALGGGPALWGVLISLVATLFTFYFLYGIAERLYDVRVARASTLVLAFFPTAFFLNAVYTEALFLMFTTGSLWALYTRRDLLLAGLFGALAAATRNLGLLLLIPLLVEWYRGRREFGSGGLAGVLLVPAGTLAYGIFLAGRFGDPMISARQQGEYWGRTFTNPVTTLQGAWQSAVDGAGSFLNPVALFLSSSSGPSLVASNTLNLVFFALLLVLLAVGFVVLPPGLFLYSFFSLLLPILTPSPLFPLMSLPRFMLGVFPLFLVLGYLLARNRTALAVWLVLSAGGGIALTALFTTWRWVA